MKGKELYEFYKGQEVPGGKGVDDMEVRGVVVGFEDPGDCTIIKVTKGRGWDQEEHLPSDFIESEHIHCELGHWYVGRSLLKTAQQIKPMRIWTGGFDAICAGPE